MGTRRWHGRRLEPRNVRAITADRSSAPALDVFNVLRPSRSAAEHFAVFDWVSWIRDVSVANSQPSAHQKAPISGAFCGMRANGPGYSSPRSAIIATTSVSRDE